MKIKFAFHVHKEHIEFDEVMSTTDKILYVWAYNKAQAVAILGIRLNVFLIVKGNGFAYGDYYYKECSRWFDRYVVTIA